MIEHKLMYFLSEDLAPGFKGDKVDFTFRAFSERSTEAQIAYRELEADLYMNGIQQPLITYQGRVLIGMRRFEILKDRIDGFQCFEIQEDVFNWDRDDIDRLESFKAEMYGDTPGFIG